MRQKTYVSEDLGHVAVYWEDLQRLMRIVQASCDQVKIEVDDVEYETLEELREHCGNSVSELKIEGSNQSPYRTFSVAIHSWGATMRLYGNDDAFVKAGNEIRLLFSKRRRFGSRILRGAPAGVAMYLLMASVLTLIVLANLRISVPGWLWVVSASLLVMAHLIVATETASKPKVSLQARVEAGFVVRNRDDVVKLLLAGLVGAVLTLLLRKLFGI